MPAACGPRPQNVAKRPLSFTEIAGRGSEFSRPGLRKGLFAASSNATRYGLYGKCFRRCKR